MDASANLSARQEKKIFHAKADLSFVKLSAFVAMLFDWKQGTTATSTVYDSSMASIYVTARQTLPLLFSGKEKNDKYVSVQNDPAHLNSSI